MDCCARVIYTDLLGPSVVTTGYVCANCTEGSYGWMLNILSEFQHEVPVILILVPQSESIIPHKIKKGHPLHQLAGLCSQ